MFFRLLVAMLDITGHCRGSVAVWGIPDSKFKGLQTGVKQSVAQVAVISLVQWCQLSWLQQTSLQPAERNPVMRAGGGEGSSVEFQWLSAWRFRTWSNGALGPNI